MPDDRESPSSLIAHFTNRVSEQAALQRLLDTAKDQPLPLLHFYGVGGGGKSWLLRKLLANVQAAGVPVAHLELEGLPSTQEAMVRGLGLLRQKLAVLHMPRFDLAYAWYLKHAGFTTASPARFTDGPLGSASTPSST